MEKNQNPKRKESRAPRAQGDPPAQAGTGETLFDTWLENKLKSAYSSVLEEPVPDELIRLLTQRLRD